MIQYSQKQNLCFDKMQFFFISNFLIIKQKHIILFFCGLLSCTTLSLSAQKKTPVIPKGEGFWDSLKLTELPSYKALKISKPPRIDGILDDECWKDAHIATDFVVIEPNFGKKTDRKTIAKIVYDNLAIYVSFYCYDSDPKNIRRELTQRDDISGAADYIGVAFDTYDDNLNGTRFFVTAAGVQADSRMQPDDNDFSLDLVWDSRVTLQADGWIAELKIPYSALRFPKKAIHRWGMQLNRFVNHKAELSGWSPVNPSVNGIVNQWGNLDGLQDIASPIRLQFSPYIAANIGQYPQGSTKAEGYNNSRSINGGMDVKYGLNESFTLDMTLIPDFGQVRSDDRLLNLSPFEVRFDERRPFFTEGTDLFNKGDVFYSRRIGGTPQGYWDVENQLNTNEKIIKNPNETQLLNASKISGRTNSKVGIGVLNAVAAPMFATVQDTVTGIKRQIQTADLTNYNVLVYNPALKNNSEWAVLSATTLRNGTGRDANVTLAGFRFRDSTNTYEISGMGRMSNIFSTPSANEPQQIETGFTTELNVGKVSGKWTWNIGHQIQSNRWNPNDLGIFVGNNFILSYLNVNYSTFQATKYFAQTNTWFNLNHSLLYKPTVFRDINTNAGFWGLLKNQNWVNVNIFSYPVKYYDYFEPRVEGKKFQRPPFLYVGAGGGTDRRKKVFANIWAGFAESPWVDDPYFDFNLNVTWRISNKFSITGNTYIENNRGNYGWVDNNSDGSDITLGRRNRITSTQTLSWAYKFSPFANLTFRSRHYWSAVRYQSFFRLLDNGELEQRTWQHNHDVSSNFFNIDLIYTYQFAPGSFLTATYKNATFLGTDRRDLVDGSYIKNLYSTFDAPQTNTFSLKLIYFLDYLDFKRLRKNNNKKASMSSWQPEQEENNAFLRRNRFHASFPIF